MIFLDIQYPAGEEVKSDGEAVFKMPKEMIDFMKDVENAGKIIGVEYIPGSPSIGFLVQKHPEEKKSSIIVPGRK